MTTVSSPTTATATLRSTSSIGVLVAATASTLTAYGAHGWSEVLVVVPLIVAVTGLVFGWVLPRTAGRERPSGAVLGLAIPGALLLLPAFWSGIPLVLGAAALLAGRAANGRSRSGAAVAGMALGALTVVGYLAIYASEMAAGIGGFDYL